MAAVQAQLDAATRAIEGLRDEEDQLGHEIHDAEERIAELKSKNADLQDDIEARARLLYRTGGTGIVEALLESRDLSELAARTDALSRISSSDTDVFIRVARNRAELEALTERLAEKRDALKNTIASKASEIERQQALFEGASDDYEALQRALARQASAAAVPAAPAQSPVIKLSGDMACPVAGPVSFVDSWGAPRAGHTHQGVDMMAATGTPVVAITAGNITMSSYGSSAGNWQILSGDDGNAYWYMHNDQNIVNSGHVSVGQQIATVGSTGNASSTAPHLHFEFHPGGGSAVNPYPLVSSLC